MYQRSIQHGHRSLPYPTLRGRAILASRGEGEYKALPARTMSPYRRNILVGASVIVALAILGWMILQFGEAPARFLTKPTIPIHFESERADGLGEGSIISYRGVAVGHITDVKL